MFTLVHRKTPMRSPAFSPDGEKLAAAQSRGGLVVWDLASRTMESDLATGPYANGVLFPAADRLFVGNWGNLLCFSGLATLPQAIPKPPGYEYHGVRAATAAP